MTTPPSRNRAGVAGRTPTPAVPTLTVKPSSLSEEEAVRRFTGATEILLRWEARYQEAEQGQRVANLGAEDIAQ